MRHLVLINSVYGTIARCAFGCYGYYFIQFVTFLEFSTARTSKIPEVGGSSLRLRAIFFFKKTSYTSNMNAGNERYCKFRMSWSDEYADDVTIYSLPLSVY